MKKIMMALCAVSMIVAVACSKDSDGPSAPSVAPGTSGTIASIDVNSSPYEVWNWNDSMLTSVSNASTGLEKVRFGYNANGRVVSVTFTGLTLAGIPLSGTLGLQYDGNKIALVNMVRNDTALFSAAISYDGNKMSHATVSLGNSMLLAFFNSVAAQILGSSMGLNGSLPTIDDVTTVIDFGWTGDNVTSLVLSADIQASSTLGELADMVGDLSVFGEYGATLEAAATAMPDMPVLFDVTLRDTSEFTYDNHNNPYLGYLGQLDVSTLSANNILQKNTSRAVGVQVSIVMIGQSLTVLDKTYPLTPDDATYTYQLYNQGGYPVKVAKSNGELREYHYQEKAQ